MTDQPDRTSIQPQDWPLEETTGDENSTGLRHDIGVSSTPDASIPGSSDAGLDGGRGETGTTTPGERGVDNNQR